MTDNPLEAVEALVAADTHGGASLTLFALMKTLSSDNGQYLFLLNKLRDLSPEQRQLAYALMERSTQADHPDAAWRATVERIESLIRNG